MRSIRKTAVAFEAVALALGGVMGTAGTAAAGSKGQQILIVDTTKSLGSVRIDGYDQNGGWESYCFPLTGGGSMDTWISGWWWKGQATVNWFWYSDCTESKGSTTVNVPVSQSGDWYEVDFGG